MPKNKGNLISLNDEYMYSSAHGGMYAPLRINEQIAKNVQHAIALTTPPHESCIQTMSIIWQDGKFRLVADFYPNTKCTDELQKPISHQRKTEICLKKLCNGQCNDEFMRNIIAQNILPELYNNKQK